MNAITIQHNKSIITVDYTYAESGRLKLYAVPSSYSTDGYAVTIWRDTDPEIIPACASDTAHLLAHVRFSGSDGFITQFTEVGVEVTYA